VLIDAFIAAMRYSETYCVGLFSRFSWLAEDGCAGLEPVLAPPPYPASPELSHASPSGRNGI